MSDENKKENEEQEHDVEAHRRWHGHNANEEPTASDESDDEVEAHLKHHLKS